MLRFGSIRLFLGKFLTPQDRPRTFGLYPEFVQVTIVLTSSTLVCLGSNITGHCNSRIGTCAAMLTCRVCSPLHGLINCGLHTSNCAHPVVVLWHQVPAPGFEYMEYKLE